MSFAADESEWTKHTSAGKIAAEQQRFLEAEEAFLAALNEVEKLGESDPRFVTSLDNLAGLYMKNSRQGRAAELYRQALTVREKVLGAEHIDLAENLGNLAHAQRVADGTNTSGCEQLYRRKTRILELHYESPYPEVAESLGHLATYLHFFAGNGDEAIALYERVLEIHEESLGKDHPDSLDAINNLAWVYGTLKTIVSQNNCSSGSFRSGRKCTRRTILK